MKRLGLFFKISGLVLAVLLIGTSISAQQIRVIPETKTTLKKKDIEPSALEPICDGEYLLVADDKEAALLIVSSTTKEIVIGSLDIPDPRARPPKDPQSKPVFLSGTFDWEAMAKDSENIYYLIGSHKDSTTSRLLSFRLKHDDGLKAIEVVPLKELDVKISFDQVKLTDKLTKPEIEGLAVWERGSQKELIFGIREKWSNTVRVYFSEIKTTGKLDLKPLFSFQPGQLLKAPGTPSLPWHLSSIEHLPNLGFLILTSTENGNAFNGNALWFLSEAELEKARSKDNTNPIVEPLWSEVFGEGMKAEGLSVLSSGNKDKIRAVILFDNDFGQGTQKASEIWFVSIALGIKKP